MNSMDREKESTSGDECRCVSIQSLHLDVKKKKKAVYSCVSCLFIDRHDVSCPLFPQWIACLVVVEAACLFESRDETVVCVAVDKHGQ